MASVSINLTGETLRPGGNVLFLNDEICGSGVFITVDFTPTAGVILPGFDTEAVAAARLMAAKLTELADKAEAKMAASVAK